MTGKFDCAVHYVSELIYSGVTRGGPPRVTPSRGVTPEGKNVCGQIYKE